jgi:hypothetical protein
MGGQTKLGTRLGSLVEVSGSEKISTKFQATSANEAPNLKLQCDGGPDLGLVIGYSLVLGCWSLEVFRDSIVSVYR